MYKNYNLIKKRAETSGIVFINIGPKLNLREMQLSKIILANCS